MGGVERSDVPYADGAEVCRAGEQEVGGSPLVCDLVVVLVAGTAREEEPALETLAPRCWFVDKVACSSQKQQNE